MGDILPFVLAVIFVAINGLTQLAFAQGLGFRLKPTGLAFMVAAGLGLAFRSFSPVSGQSAMIALAGRNEDERERVAALLIAAVVSTILGLAGAISTVVDFAGVAVMGGMMAGVGIMLAQIGTDFITDKKKGNFWVGMVSLVSALLIFGFFNMQTGIRPSPNVLVYTVAGSVGISTAFYLIMKKIRGESLAVENTDNQNVRPESNDPKFWTANYWKNGDWKLVSPRFTIKSILSAFALICLGIGVVTSFGVINAQMATRATGIEHIQNFDHLILITGLVDFVGVIFGGMPLEPIISATAETSWPVLGAFALMLVLGALALLGLVTKICKYMPVQSIAGFLVVIGFFETFLPNIVHGFRVGPRAANFHDNIAESAVAMGVTALTKNPFLGIVAGVLVRFIGTFFGFVA